MTPDVSVVMSVYDGARDLNATLESVLLQNDAALEFVIVDDGSSDDTPSMLDAAAARDPRVRVIHQENRGLTRALIAGCELARGRFIARQDAGDLSRPTRFAKQLRALEADASLAFVSCWTEFVGPNDEPLWISRGKGVAATPRNVLDLDEAWGFIDGPSCHPSVMMRADAYRQAGGYRAEFRFGQDWDLWYRLAAIGTFQMIAEPLYVARVEPASLSSAARDAQQELARLSLAAARARAAGKSDAEILRLAAQVRKGRPRMCAEARGLYFIGQMLRENRDARARAYFARAVRSCPAHLKSWIRLAQSLFS